MTPPPPLQGIPSIFSKATLAAFEPKDYIEVYDIKNIFDLWIHV